MSAAEAKSIRLLLMEIRAEHDVVLCRQRARQFAAGLGFTSKAQIRVATALSEIARNAFQYAAGARAEFSFVTEQRAAKPVRQQQSLVIVVRDTGPGIAALQEILDGKYRSTTGLGLGILGAQRLMDHLEITTSTAGTTVTLRQILPFDVAVQGPAQVQKMFEEILQKAPASAMDEMQLQNQELIRAVDEAKAREDEVKRVNHELAETNAGVLALYDELDTLHRVSLLLASQLELRALIQSIIDVTTELTDADLGAFYFSVEGGESWTLYAAAGRSREALIGTGPALGKDFFGADFVSGGVHRIAELLEHPTPCCASLFATAVESHVKVRSCLAVPIAASDGNVLGAIIFAAAEPHRFTERSERIVGSIAAQAVVGIEKARLYQAVQETNSAKDQFIAMLSHELRTPLNPVLAIVSSWQSDLCIPEELREDLVVLTRNVRLQARLIDDLLDLNRLINGKLELDRSLVDLHSLIESVVEICRADLEAEKQRVNLALDAERSSVAGDSARLQQVLWNVLKNAIKFSPPGEVISIATSTPAAKILRVQISDKGRGIDPESLGQIFGAFDQGKPQVLARLGGLGLGLTIAKMFVQRHGGTIVAESEGVGLGARFIIDLPLSSETVIEQKKLTTESKANTATTPARILLVEDHDDTRNTLTRLLTRKGHTVTCASTGDTARTEFANGIFDLVISDLGLPDCSGLELITDLHAIRDSPAIALSGYGMESDILKSKAAGFTAHLTKPIDFETLLSTVESLVQKPARS